jgi:hypothetical protein
MNKILIVMGAMLALTACGGGSATDAGSAKQQQQAEPPKETVFDPMISTMDRAKGVEDLNMSRKADMDAAIDGADR